MLTQHMLAKRARLFSKMLQCKVLHQRRPVVAYLLITDRCNLRCRYCFVDVSTKRNELSTQEWKSIIDEIVARGTRMICLMGGEPLLHPDIGEIVSHVRSKGILCDMTTNGWLVPKKIDVVKQVDSLMVSLDGNEAGNDSNRGKGSFKRALEAIRVARENSVVVRVNAVMTRQSQNSVEFLLDLAEQYDLYVTFSITAEFPHEQEELAQEIMLSDQEIKNLYVRLKEFRRQGRRVLFSEPCLDYVINYPLPYNKIIFQGDAEHENYYEEECLFGRTMFYIDANGDIYPCASLWNTERYQPKNIQGDRFDVAWENMAGLGCITCFCPGVPEWNYVMSLRGMAHGLKVSLAQAISRQRRVYPQVQ